MEERRARSRLRIGSTRKLTNASGASRLGRTMRFGPLTCLLVTVVATSCTQPRRTEPKTAPLAPTATRTKPSTPPKPSPETSTESNSGVTAPQQTKIADPEIAAPAAAPGLKRNRGCSTNPDADLSRGRKFASKSHWQEALAAYDPAVRKRPGDATLRAERGLALYKLGALEHAESDWLLGLGLTSEQVTLAALHFNLGLLYETRKMPDESRLHFALSESLGNRAAGRRLGAASRCRATWTLKPDESPAPLAFNLRELLGARQFAGCPAIPGEVSEQESAKWLCRNCSYGQWTDAGACKLRFPLDATDGTMSFASFNFFAEKLSATRSLYIYFRNHAETRIKRRIEGGWLILEEPREDTLDLSDGLGSTLYASPEFAYTYTVGDSAQIDAARQSCEPEYEGNAVGPDGMAGPSPLSGNWRFPITTSATRATVLYSVTSRAPLLRIKSYGGGVTVSVAGTHVNVSGLGCNETIELSEAAVSSP